MSRKDNIEAFQKGMEELQKNFNEFFAYIVQQIVGFSESYYDATSFLSQQNSLVPKPENLKIVEAEFDKIIQTDRFVTNMMKSVETLNIVVQNMEKVMNDLQEEAKKEKDHLVPNINKIIEMLEKMIPQVYSQPEQKDKQMKEMKSAKESKKDAKEGEQMKKSLEITERTNKLNETMNNLNIATKKLNETMNNLNNTTNQLNSKSNEFIVSQRNLQNANNTIGNLNNQLSTAQSNSNSYYSNWQNESNAHSKTKQDLEAKKRELTNKTNEVNAVNSELKTTWGHLNDLDRVFNLNHQERMKIHEWTNKNIDSIVFDSTHMDWRINSSIFDKNVIGKSNLLFVIEDRKGCKFGGFLSKPINRCDEWINDGNAFIFSLKSNGRINGQKKYICSKSQFAFRLAPASAPHYLFLFGGYSYPQLTGENITCRKSNSSEKSYCSNGVNTCFKTGNDPALSIQRDFDVERLVVIQMK